VTDLTRVSVVIPCKNAEPWIGTQLDALAHQDYPGPIEIIVADNGSDDASRDIVGRNPGVRLVDASARRGPNYARNTGATLAQGDLILTCDADDIVDHHWVMAMAAALAEYDLVVGRLDFQTLNPESGSHTEARVPPGPRLGFLPGCGAGNFGIRAEVFRALGGWDDSMDYGFEDTELCWRAQLAGYRLGRADDAVVQYRLRTETTKIVRDAYHGAQNLPVLVRRFRGQGMSLRPIIWRAMSFVGYLVVASPAALFSHRIRTEWLRKAAVAAGVVRGMFRRRRG
jgi:glycosyltransferase involved in cell wall biosynthesis